MVIGQLLSETRKKAPGTLALWFNERSWTYAELDDATDRIAAALLAAGVQAGDCVALFMPNCPELILGYFSCFKIGAITAQLPLSASGSAVCHRALRLDDLDSPFGACGRS